MFVFSGDPFGKVFFLNSGTNDDRLLFVTCHSFQILFSREIFQKNSFSDLKQDDILYLFFKI